MKYTVRTGNVLQGDYAYIYHCHEASSGMHQAGQGYAIQESDNILLRHGLKCGRENFRPFGRDAM